MERILILGGGTGGTILANTLCKRLRLGEAEVMVISASDRHFFQPAWLYVPFEKQSARAVSRTLRSVLDRRVNLLIGNVVDLEMEKNWVAHKHHTMGVLEGARTKGERHDYKSAQK